MEIQNLHLWPRRQREAAQLQEQLKTQVVVGGSLDHVDLIAGVETAYDHTQNVLLATACVFSFPELNRIEKADAAAEAYFPYIPGLHVFREGPVILGALAKLNTTPDVVLIGGHGIAHPLGIGMASHIGLFLKIPTIGCARRRLAGEHDEIGSDKGSSAPLIVANKRAGYVYRSRSNVKPIFISPGHLCGIDDAYNLVIKCITEYRIPEPLRSAHRFANQLKRSKIKNYAEVMPAK